MKSEPITHGEIPTLKNKANSNEVKFRDVWIDMAKGASIFLVVFYHSTKMLQNQMDVENFIWTLNHFLYPIRMPVFFLISGYLASRAVRRPWLILLERKTAFYIYIFSIWTLITVGVRSAFLGINWPSFLELSSYWIAPISTLWFIWALAAYFPIAKIIVRLSVVFQHLCFALTLLPYLMIRGGFVSFDNYVYENILIYLPIFIFGVLFTPSIKSYLEIHAPWLLPLAIIAYLTLWQMLDIPSSLTLGFVNLSLSMTGLLVGATSAILFSRIRLLRITTGYLGRNTLSIYVVHSLLGWMLIALLPKFVWALPLMSIIGPIIWTLFLTCGSLLLYKLLIRIGLNFVFNMPSALRSDN